MTEYERKREEALLTDEEINTELIKYANEICESNPIRYWNHSEMIRRAIQAQLDKALKTDGIEIRAENQDLPRFVYLEKLIPMCDWERIVNDIKEAGFVKVIKEEEH